MSLDSELVKASKALGKDASILENKIAIHYKHALTNIQNTKLLEY